MNVKRAVLWVVFAVPVAFFGLVAWAFQYYRPTLEYAYVDITPVNLVVTTLGLLILGSIMWRVFRK
jgi:hypothetical protein